MMPEQVQSRPHRGKDFVDLRLPGIGASPARKRPKRLGRFMGQQDIDVAQPFTGLDFFAHEVPALVVPDAWATRCRKTPGYGRRELRSRRLVPRRRERPAQTHDLHDGLSLVEDFYGGSIFDVMEILRQVVSRDRIEVVVVAVNPVDAGAERLVAPRLVGDVPDTEPERDLRVLRHDGARAVEGAVNISERAENYFVVWPGTSRSVLSQMKSLLL